MKTSLSRGTGAALVAAVFAGGCGAGTDEPAREDRQVTQRSTELAPAIDGCNAFAWSLYDQLRVEPGNRFFSPFSVYAALSMTAAGARGSTATQLSALLGISANDAQHHSAFGALLRDLGGEHQGRGYQLHIANRLYARLGVTVEPEYADLLANDYAAPLEQLDFAGDADGARDTINAWVATQTRDRIQELLPVGSVDASTAIVLANAIYFKAKWAEQFDPGYTVDGAFTRADGTEVTVPMMSAMVDVRLSQDFTRADAPTLLELDYEDHEVSFVVVLPPTYDGLPVVEATLVSGGYDDLLAAAQETELVVELPRFELRYQSSLVDPLRALGATDLFCSGAADFSGIAPGLCVSDVLHQAFVTVDEEGTEAAAATAVVMDDSAPMAVSIDRPFVFAIRDRLTGTILFLGRVEDPS
jgi:serpin B